MKKRIIILSIVIVVTIVSAFMIPNVETNYDLTTYLPDDSETQIGIDTLEDEFGERSLIELQINDIEVVDVIDLSTQIEALNHVESVIWLDDYVDLNTVPIDYIDENTLQKFYINENALLQITIKLDSYDLDIESVISQIELILVDYEHALRGNPINNIENRRIADQEVLKIMLVIVPIFIIILLIASSSWIEPLILLITLGFAVILNLGTNIFLPNVSYITKTMALALQLALSLDYGLFFLHRYYEEKEKTEDSSLAIKLAFRHSFSSITASALTTMAGFLSLLFMSYTIGFDIGVVLSKGIFFSYLTTMIVTPILVYLMSPLIKKTMHKSFLRPFKNYISTLYKLRYALIVVFVILTIGSIYLSNQSKYLYGTNTSFNEDRQVAIDEKMISDTFGSYQNIVVLVPNGEILREIYLAESLLLHQDIIEVQSLVTIVDPSIPRDFIPDDVKYQFVGPNYTRFIILTTLTEENQALYQLQDDLEFTIEVYYEDYHIIGMPQATSNIKDLVLNDQLMITLVSMSAIFIILLITFKSFIIPILLVLIIQSAIWMNLSILYLQDIQTIYIGYLVVMAIQLGATIDYAVLLTNRYVENRKTMQPQDAIDFAYKKSFITIMISALVLSIAGFTEGIFSNISSVKEIGFLLGKGTMISFIYILLFLPVCLVILDKILYVRHFKNK